MGRTVGLLYVRCFLHRSGQGLKTDLRSQLRRRIHAGKSQTNVEYRYFHYDSIVYVRIRESLIHFIVLFMCDTRVLLRHMCIFLHDFSRESVSHNLNRLLHAVEWVLDSKDHTEHNIK